MQIKIDTDVLSKIKDGFDFTQKLLEDEIWTGPQCFGLANYFCIVFSAPNDVLADAYTRIAEF